MQKSNYNYNELIDCGNGKLFGAGNAKLPLPPMLMFDRISEINTDEGIYKKGCIKAELDIKNGMWFFNCHFKDDPVMPGCLGLDALWQLLGFYLAWKGNYGVGRALGCNKVGFKGQVLPSVKLLQYEIDINRVREGKAVLGIADAKVIADGKQIYTAEGIKVGLFTSLDDFR